MFKSNFFFRILTALLILPLFIYILFLNNYLLIFFLILIFLVSIYELQFLFQRNLFLLFFLLALIITSLFLVVLLRGISVMNFYFLIWIMCIAWLTDIGGYIIGNLIKGPKFTKWSPNKTISGLVGSITISQLSYFILYFSNNIIFTKKIFLIQLILCVVAILGDIFFSYIKRINNIKDYSNLLPGHGGLLDRIDSLIFVVIFSYLFKILDVY